MDLAALTLATFEPRVGEAFTLHADDEEKLALTLREATMLGERPGGRDAFSVVFVGPSEPVLPQAIYRLRHDELGALEIFIVPIAQDAEGTSYEAVFT
jgi:hypothetical protein